VTREMSRMSLARINFGSGCRAKAATAKRCLCVRLTLGAESPAYRLIAGYRTSANISVESHDGDGGRVNVRVRVILAYE
jgi:hypothetical protein